MWMRFCPSHTGKHDPVTGNTPCTENSAHVTSRYPVSSTATLDPLAPPAPRSASGAIQIAAATIGNALEWFDILVYSYFATTIAGVFFPNSNQLVSLLLTFGSFGLSYIARPVGAVVLGAYADQPGSKTE